MVLAWQTKILHTIRQSKATIIGQREIPNQAQADVGIAIIKAFDHPNAIIYFEATAYDEIEQPGDIIIAHPDTGLIVIEVKGYSIDFIKKIQANQLVVQYNDQSFPSHVNPIKQASSVMYRIKGRTRAELELQNITSMPMFNVLAALPNIKTSEWRGRGYDSSYPINLLLFQEHCQQPEQLRKRLLRLIESKQEKIKTPPLMPIHIEAIKRAIGDSDAVNRARPPRDMIDTTTLGGRIDELLSIERHISPEQQALSCLPVEGYPRLVRGVAGSGKTIVLTKMIARYLARELSKPKDMFIEEEQPLRVAVICFNRTLVPMLMERIQMDFIKIAHREIPNHTNIVIRHLNGLMNLHAWEDEENATVNQTMPYIKITGDMKEPDKRATKYRQQLEQYPLTHLYDAIFIDEAQDITPSEFLLLSDMTKVDPRTGEKNLIIFYDDAQNLYGRTRPVWKDLGLDLGRGQRSRVMKVCYRNTQEIVELGYNVLLGSQAPDDMQIQTRQYTDINYLLQQNLVEDLGDHIKIKFTTRTYKKPTIREFITREQEIDYLTRFLHQLIVNENVRPEDILVLFKSIRPYGDLEKKITERLPNIGIDGFNKPFRGKEKDTFIFTPNHLTLSTIHGAKGYDAQVVILLGADMLATDIVGRASFYVAVTRAIMALYVTGIKTQQPNLLDEALAINNML